MVGVVGSGRMQPEEWSTSFPDLSGSVQRIFRNAKTESREDVEEYLDKYEYKKYTYIPVPESDEYYNRKTGSFEDLVEDQYVDLDISLRNLFELLSEYPFLLVDTMEGLEVYFVSEDEYYFLPEDAPDDAELMDIRDLEEGHPNIIEEITGDRHRFVNRADLNRREVREALYPIIAELESEIAEAVKEDVDDPVDLYHNASESVVGRREKDILNDIELHTAEYFGLGDMIGLLKGRGHLWDEFGFESANDVDDRLRSIQRLRNCVMHSNRTLIRKPGDVEKTLERVNDAQKIIAEARDIPLKNLEAIR